MDEKAVSKFIDTNKTAFVNKHLNSKGPFDLKPQYKLSYGAAVDWAVIDRGTNKIIGLIECKGEPDLTEFVRGLGQVEQYYREMKNRPADFANDAKTLYVAGIKTAKKIPHWDRMYFDEADNLVLIDDSATGATTLPTDEYALYRKKDIEKLQAVKSDDLILTDIPFARDVRLYEVYMGLMALYEDNKNQIFNGGTRNIRTVLDAVLTTYATANSGNSRNVGILLRDLGLIDEYNIPTEKGMVMLKSKYIDFIKNIIFDSYNGVVINIVTAMLNIASNKGLNWKNMSITQGEIKAELLRMYNGKKLKNLTDDSAKKNNFIGTCLLILEQELGAVTSIKVGTTKQYQFNYLPLKELSMSQEINDGIINNIPPQLINYMTALGYTDWIS